jgi:hypothetical protein
LLPLTFLEKRLFWDHDQMLGTRHKFGLI